MKKITSVCPYCGAGCKLKLVVDNNKIIRAEAADGVTNQNQLCLKGYYGWDFLNDTQLLTPRLKQPMIRYQKGGAFTPVSWQEAIRYTASKLREIKEKHGPRAIMTTGSSRGTGNETNYVMQKFARAVLNTNNVDCCARVCHGPSVAGLQQALADEPGRVQMNPADAQRLGIADKQLVWVSSRRGKVISRADLSDRINPGAVYMTYQWWVGACNELTQDNLDPISKTPETKYCAVKVEAIADQQWAERYAWTAYSDMKARLKAAADV
ncbi:molybdopterin dinucleotide binding domain-containing protein [Klebsiella pneumoniae]